MLSELEPGSRSPNSFNQSSGVAIIGSCLPFVDELRVRGVTLDSRLTFDDHVSGLWSGSIAQFPHTGTSSHTSSQHQPPKRRPINAIACSMVFNRLDYCNLVLYGITAHNISRLRRACRTHWLAPSAWFVQIVCNAASLITALAADRCNNCF